MSTQPTIFQHNTNFLRSMIHIPYKKYTYIILAKSSKQLASSLLFFFCSFFFSFLSLIYKIDIILAIKLYNPNSAHELIRLINLKGQLRALNLGVLCEVEPLVLEAKVVM